MAIAKDWIVDGITYTTMKAVFREAVKRGYKGTFGAIVSRMTRDAGRELTFSRLAMPILTPAQGAATTKGFHASTEGAHWKPSPVGMWGRLGVSDTESPGKWT